MVKPIQAIVTASPTRNASALLRYVSDEKKKGEERFIFQSGINGAIPTHASAQMRRNRQRFGKDGTRVRDGKKEGRFVQAYHVIESFGREGSGALDPNDPDDLLTAHEQGRALAARLAGSGHMATVTTQIDGKSGCIHNHLVIDAVSQVDGRSMKSALIFHKNLAPMQNEVLLTQGLENTNTLSKGANKKTVSEAREADQYERWVREGRPGVEPFSAEVLKKRIASVMADPRTIDEKSLRAVGLEYGVDVRLTQARGGAKRGASYRMVRAGVEGAGSSLDRRSASKLGTNFSRSALDEAMEVNRARLDEVRLERAKASATRSKAAPKVAPVVEPVVEQEAPTTTPQVEQEVPKVEPKIEQEAPQGGAFVSGLRGVEAFGSQAKQDKKTLEALAAFEENAVETDIFDEAAIPPRITSRFMEDYGENLTPVVRRTLARRAEKLDVARNFYERGDKRKARGKVFANEAQNLHNEAKLLREEVKVGNYELTNHKERLRNKHVGKPREVWLQERRDRGRGR